MLRYMMQRFRRPVTGGMADVTAQLSAVSRPVIGRLPDGRTRVGRELRRIRRALIAHVGGSPSTTQAMLIDRAASLMLRLAQIDEDISAGREINDERYLAATGALRRVMSQLGLRAAAPKPLDARQIMFGKASAA